MAIQKKKELKTTRKRVESKKLSAEKENNLGSTSSTESEVVGAIDLININNIIKK